MFSMFAAHSGVGEGSDPSGQDPKSFGSDYYPFPGIAASSQNVMLLRLKIDEAMRNLQDSSLPNRYFLKCAKDQLNYLTSDSTDVDFRPKDWMSFLRDVRRIYGPSIQFLCAGIPYDHLNNILGSPLETEEAWQYLEEAKHSLQSDALDILVADVEAQLFMEGES